MIMSICIPSHNRYYNLNKIIESILLSKSDQFEVVIMDNGSDKSIYDLNINDTRIKINKRMDVVSGPQNMLDVLCAAKGKYCMMCLDKDFIKGENLDEFLEILHQIDITGGFCLQNCQTTASNLIIKSDEFYKWAYRSVHPSGMFFNTRIVKEEIKNNQYNAIESIFYNNSFQPDLLLAKCLHEGNLLYYRAPLVSTEKRTDASKTVSYTYTAQNNYFSPEQRVKQFQIYLSHLNGMYLTPKEYGKTVKTIINRTINQSTFAYKSIMANKFLCCHHGLETRVINGKELRLIYNKSKNEIYISKNILLIKSTLDLQMAQVSLNFWVRYFAHFVKSELRGGKS